MGLQVCRVITEPDSVSIVSMLRNFLRSQYWLSLAHVASLFPGFYSVQAASSFADLCSTSILRSLNRVLAVICSIIVYDINTHSKPTLDDKKAMLQAVVLSLYPLHWFFTFLYYTDVASVTAVLAIYLACRRKEMEDAVSIEAGFVVRERTKCDFFAVYDGHGEDATIVVESTYKHFGRIDILVNAAAGNFLVSAEDLSPNGFEQLDDGLELSFTADGYTAPYTRSATDRALLCRLAIASKNSTQLPRGLVDVALLEGVHPQGEEEGRTYEIRDNMPVGDSTGVVVEVGDATRPVRCWVSERSTVDVYWLLPGSNRESPNTKRAFLGGGRSAIVAS
ncbi:hypothetical protein K1719_009111 [Acacia pycnantha]|nr:hypothetical protein K1719_009111 [Acacia pycnantha]